MGVCLHGTMIRENMPTKPISKSCRHNPDGMNYSKSMTLIIFSLVREHSWIYCSMKMPKRMDGKRYMKMKRTPYLKTKYLNFIILIDSCQKLIGSYTNALFLRRDN